MEAPLINILIRTSNRPAGFMRCIRSVAAQSYPNIRIIVGYDNPKALTYIPAVLEPVFVSSDRSMPFFYDDYCNQLKNLVAEGYFMFLDDDDVLLPDCLRKLTLSGPGALVKLQRQNMIVPAGLDFLRGQIGMPCLILHHSLKNIAHVPATGSGDYFWIREVIKQVEIPLLDIIVVLSFGRGLGKMAA